MKYKVSFTFHPDGDGDDHVDLTYEFDYCEVEGGCVDFYDADENDLGGNVLCNVYKIKWEVNEA